MTLDISMVMVVEFHSWADGIQKRCIAIISLKGYFNILLDKLLVQIRQKLVIFSIQSQFLMPKNSLIFPKTIFVSGYLVFCWIKKCAQFLTDLT